MVLQKIWHFVRIMIRRGPFCRAQCVKKRPLHFQAVYDFCAKNRSDISIRSTLTNERCILLAVLFFLWWNSPIIVCMNQAPKYLPISFAGYARKSHALCLTMWWVIQIISSRSHHRWIVSKALTRVICFPFEQMVSTLSGQWIWVTSYLKHG